MEKYNEKQILKIIIWAPMTIIFILSILITFIKVSDNKIMIKKNILELKTNFLLDKSNEIKLQVDSMYKHIYYFKKTSEEELKKHIKDRVYEAHDIALNIYKENINKSKAKILKLIKDALRNIRFNNGRSYFFLHDITGNNLLYPLERSLEGKNYSDLQDINGYYLVKTIMKKIKYKTEGFDSYYWEKPNKSRKRIYKKNIFTKYFEPLNIAISTGEYLDDYEDMMRDKTLKYINNLALDNNKYYFITNVNNIILAHSDKSFINKNINNISLSNGNSLQYLFYKKERDKTFIQDKYADMEKTSYIRYFDDWQWIIGTGYYDKGLNEYLSLQKIKLEETGKKDLLKIIIIILIVTLILLFLSFYLSSLVKNKFLTYKNKLLKEIEKNREKDLVLAQQTKMAAMGEMLANIAHQWRQPLSVISTSSSGIRLKKEFNDLSDKELFSSLDIIDNSAQHLSKTIDDFSNFFSTDKKLILISTNKLWNNLNTLISAQFKFNKITFVLNIKDENISILSNELMQVLLNLVNNSRDQLILKNIEERFIFASIKVKNSNLLISIKDNAGGIKKDILARVFEPYFTTKHKAQGTGIGLYMCEQIVTRNLKGTITVKNEKFKYKNIEYTGAVFTIIIPSNMI